MNLDAIKLDKRLTNIPLLRQSRLSVLALTEQQFERILHLAETSY